MSLPKLTEHEKERLVKMHPLAERAVEIIEAQEEDLNRARTVLRLRAMALEPGIYAAFYRALHGRDE